MSTVDVTRSVALARLMARPAAWLLCAIAIFAGNARAESPLSLQMRSNATTVKVGDVFQIDVILSVRGQDAVDELELPDFEGFAIEQTHESQKASMGIRNGRRAISVEHRRTFLLRAETPGTFRIGQARALMGKDIARAAPLTIKVIGAAPNKGPTQNGHQNDDDGENSGDAAGDDNASSTTSAAATLAEPGARFGGNPPRIFLELRPDKTSAFVGEQITVVGEVWSQVALGAYPRVPGQKPSGFLCLPLSDGIPLSATQRRLNGRNWYVYPVTRDALFGLSPGERRLPAMEISVSPAGSFFSNSRDVRVRSAPVVLDVKPLPTPQPASFTGAVGDFQLRTALRPARTTVGEPVTLLVEVAGWGNLDDVKTPPAPALPGTRAFPPTQHRDRKDRDGAVAGRVLEETLLQPSEVGTLTVPALSFSFFNPVEGRYVTRTSTPLQLRVDDVRGGPGAAAKNPGSGVGGTAGTKHTVVGGARPLALDINPDAPARAPVVPMGGALFGIGLVVGVLGRRRRRVAASVLGQTQARRQARRVTANARAEAGDAGGLSEVIVDALADRCGDDVRGSANAALPRLLESRGLTPSMAARCASSLGAAEAARFAPGGASRATVGQLLEVLAEVDGGSPPASRGQESTTSGRSDDVKAGGQ